MTENTKETIDHIGQALDAIDRDRDADGTLTEDENTAFDLLFDAMQHIAPRNHRITFDTANYDPRKDFGITCACRQRGHTFHDHAQHILLATEYAE